MPETVWGGVTQFVINGGISEADAIRVTKDASTHERVHLNSDDKIGVKADEGLPEDFELVGVAEDFQNPSIIWNVYANPEGSRWTALVVDDEADAGRIAEDWNGDDEEE